MRLTLAFLTLLVLPFAAHAASFDCVKASSPAEKTVCAHADLSTLDSDLNAAYNTALSAAATPTTLRDTQRSWIKQRDACGTNVDCLQHVYNERLERLHTVVSTRRGGDARWVQVWQMDNASPTVASQLSITGKMPSLHFNLQANNGGNAGGLEGDITVEEDRATYRDKDGCQLDFVRTGQRLTVRQNANDCGAGMGVSYAGHYLPASAIAAKPTPSLATLKVLDPAQDTIAHALLGNDYAALLDTINAQGEAVDQDGLGASVNEYFVRGVASTNAAVVMRKDGQLWIGLLVLDKQNDSRVRYYTNVPAWKKRLPKTIKAWNQWRYPVDMMP